MNYLIDDFRPPPGLEPTTTAGVKYTPIKKLGRNEDARAKSTGALLAQIQDIANNMDVVGWAKGLIRIYAIAQIMLESDWLTSSVANEDNNYSGINWINRPYQNATRGRSKPASEGGGYYAHFNNFNDYLADFKRILSLNTGGKGRPIDATSAAEYGERLRANHYFTDPNYHTKFNAALKKVSDAVNYGLSQDKQFLQQRSQGQDTFTVTAGKGLTSNETFNAGQQFSLFTQWVTDHPVIAVGTILGIIIAIKAASR